MPSERAERIEALFHAAADLAPEEQRAFLAQACNGDGSLRQTVEELLEASSRASSHPGWNAPAMQLEAQATASALDAETFERYKLLERIGAGGMGVVYRAVRDDDEFQKTVAIKLIQHRPSEAGYAEAVRRFRGERQILARLEHPNIIALLDGGSTRDGLPFLVMEYVEGVPLNRYLAQDPLSQRELLELFLAICSGVAYAHRNLVIHRDLKPANILITVDGTPKLLDFGIAKLLGGTGTGTATAAKALTPDYASPEQIRGEALTTSTDVYSLGVILYEMLSGARPHAHTTDPVTLAQAICTEIPAQLRSRAGKPVDEDLNTIVSTALRKEPTRRYSSVERFADDIRRYLDGFPIEARRDSALYRARKFAERNRVMIAAGVLALASLIAGLGAAAWQSHIANQRYNDVRALANAYLFEFHDAIRDLSGATAARHLVVKRGLEFLDKLAKDRGNDPGLARELAKGYTQIAAIQAGRASSLGDLAGGISSCRRALAIREELFARSPRDAQLAQELGDSYAQLGAVLHDNGNIAEASILYAKAEALLLRFRTPAVNEKLATLYFNWGNLAGNSNYNNLGKPREALELYRKGAAAWKGVPERSVQDPTSLLTPSLFLAGSAAVHQALNENQEAVNDLRQAIANGERLTALHPANFVFKRNSAVDHRSLSMLLVRMNRLEEARVEGNRATQSFKEIAAADRASVRAQEEATDCLWSQGYIAFKLKDYASARRQIEAAVADYRQILKDHPGEKPTAMRTAYQLLADLGLETKDARLTIQNAKNELEMDEEMLKRNANNVSALRNRGVAYGQIGKAHELLAAAKPSEWREARAWHQRSLKVWLEQQQHKTLIPAYASALEREKQAVARCEQAAGKL